VSRYWCEQAWLGPGRLARDVLVTVDGARFADVAAGVTQAPAGAEARPGLTLPGLANCHSHAFHRALRGRTEAAGRGTFWTWREQMYAIAARLDPESLRRLARATYAEMALAGITCVGEFHYLHHRPGGAAYADPNAMGTALLDAAEDAGLRIALLDACYLTGAVGAPVDGVQQRFSDGDAARWAERADLLRAGCAGDDRVVVGCAVHSVRAVPAEQIGVVAEWSRRHAAPLHAHVSEQRAENAACVEAYGRSPTALLADHGALGPRATAVHATHLSDDDVALLAGSRSSVCLCPTTERDLADGIGPGAQLSRAGVALTVGSDSQAVIDLLAEVRAVELDQRLASEQRGHWSADQLLAMATGHSSLGFPDAGVIAPGAWADLVTLEAGSIRTAGTGGGVETAVFAAGAADVRQVVAGGRVVVREGRHTSVDVPAELSGAVGELWS
jgi:formiminoglutamate deiminase